MIQLLRHKVVLVLIGFILLPFIITHFHFNNQSSQRLRYHRQYPQDASDKENPLRFSACTGPYVPLSGFGIDSATPQGCTIDQAHVFMRHGERYPTTGVGASFEKTLEKFNNPISPNDFTGYHGHLSFLKKWEYWVPDNSSYEMLSTTGPYAGSHSAFVRGVALRKRYNRLYNNNGSKYSIFIAGQQRLIDTAKAFARGFFKQDYDNVVDLKIIPEDANQGLNTLTPFVTCQNFDFNDNKVRLSQYPSDYLEDLSILLNNETPGLNLTKSDVYNIFGLCDYELNSRGSSEWCNIISKDNWLNYAYYRDIFHYYGFGPGHKLGKVCGSIAANATATLLKTGPEISGNLIFSFTHDTDIIALISTLGLFQPDFDLPTDHLYFDNPFKSSEISPMAAHLETERLDCKERGKFVRFVLNEAVVPIPKCHSGPGFSCPLDEYVDYVEGVAGDNLRGFREKCNVVDDAPDYLKFYWE